VTRGGREGFRFLAAIGTPAAVALHHDLGPDFGKVPTLCRSGCSKRSRTTLPTSAAYRLGRRMGSEDRDGRSRMLRLQCLAPKQRSEIWPFGVSTVEWRVGQAKPPALDGEPIRAEAASIAAPRVPADASVDQTETRKRSFPEGLFWITGVWPRRDKTAVEHFLAGVWGWEAELKRRLDDAKH